MTLSPALLDHFCQLASSFSGNHDPRHADESFDLQVEEPADSPQYPIRDIFRDHLNAILCNSAYDEQQKKAAICIAQCKTADLGFNAVICPQCRTVRLKYRSCNNRNCPSCQYTMQQKWVMERNNEVIPDVPYYHMVLTLPHELNPLIQANPQLILGKLFSCSSAAVIEMCRNPQRLGAAPGIISVLHTWSQELLPHYHVHMIISGGGLSPFEKFISLKNVRKRRKRRKPGQRNDYFLPLNALTKLFRGKMMAALKDLWKSEKIVFPANQQYLSQPDQWNFFCQKLYEKDWVGHLKGTFNGKGNAIDYLARYTFKTAISNGRIKSYDGKTVTFEKTDRETGKKELVPLSATEFIRRFLCHILPKGFSRVRYSGFLSNSQKTKKLSQIHRLLNLAAYIPLSLCKTSKGKLIETLSGKDVTHCPHCGCELLFWSRASPVS